MSQDDLGYSKSKITLPEGFNFPKQHIMFVFIEEELFCCSPGHPYCYKYNFPDRSETRYVRMALDQDPFNIYPSLDDWRDAVAPGLWKEKYGEYPPQEMHLYGIWADALNPNTIPYDGPTKLTEAEQLTIHNFDCARLDLSMAMLYVMIEGLNWRPGAAISKGGYPSQQEMMAFYHHYATPIDNDPRGALNIALSLLFSEIDGHSHLMWDELEDVIQGVHAEHQKLMQGISHEH